MAFLANSRKGSVKINLRRQNTVILHLVKLPINKLIPLPNVSEKLKTSNKNAFFQSILRKFNYFLSAIPGKRKNVYVVSNKIRS